MNESRSSLYSLLTGLAGGAAAWAGIEIILWQASAFPDMRILTLSLGAVAGLMLGAVAPMAEGVRQNQPRKIVSGIIVGSLTGGLFGPALSGGSSPGPPAVLSAASLAELPPSCSPV